MPDEEFARGIAEFRRACEREDRGRAVEDEIDVFLLGRAGERLASDDDGPRRQAG